MRDVQAMKEEYIAQGLTELDRALALRTDYMQAMVYKQILMRMQALRTEDLALRSRLIAEANLLRDRAEALQKQRSSGG